MRIVTGMLRPDAKTDALQRELLCPRCEYSLHGLVGDLVRCPECGLRCDLAAMIASRWTGKWYHAPRFSMLLWPVFCFVLGSFGLFVLGLNLIEERGELGVAFFVALMSIALLWLVLMAIAGRQLPHAQGVVLALFAHVLVAGYLVGVIGFGSLLIRQINLPVMSAATVINVLGLIIAALFLLTCRWCEKYIARQCIRAYLIRAASGNQRS